MKDLMTYLTILGALVGLLSVFASVVVAWGITRYRQDSLEKRVTAIETSQSNDRKELNSKVGDVYERISQEIAKIEARIDSGLSRAVREFRAALYDEGHGNRPHFIERSECAVCRDECRNHIRTQLTSINRAISATNKGINIVTRSLAHLEGRLGRRSEDITILKRMGGKTLGTPDINDFEGNIPD